MGAGLMEGGVELGELQFGDGAQSVFERMTGEAQSGTRDVHDSLRTGETDDGVQRNLWETGLYRRGRKKERPISSGVRFLNGANPRARNEPQRHTPYAQLVLTLFFRFYNPPPLCRVKDGSFFGGPIVRQSRFRRLLGAIVAAAVAAYSGLPNVIAQERAKPPERPAQIQPPRSRS